MPLSEGAMDKYCPTRFEKFPETQEYLAADGETQVASSSASLVGSVLDNKYQIISELGHGGMGVVYVAEQAIVKRRVALKVLRPELCATPDAAKRFLVEARAMASLRNPYIITMYDFGVTSDRLLYYTMELLSGVPLTKLILSEAPMAPARSAALMAQACLALSDAHEQGILHRDIKPDNLFITSRMGLETLTVLDFGIAKLTNEASLADLTASGGFCCTPAYASPEQLLGKPASPRSDLYSLACVLFEMLTRVRPFSGDSPLMLAAARIQAEAPAISSANRRLRSFPALESFMHRSLAREPAVRPQSASEFARDLLAALAKDSAVQGISMEETLCQPCPAESDPRSAALCEEAAKAEPLALIPRKGDDGPDGFHLADVVSTSPRDRGASDGAALGSVRPKRHLPPFWVLACAGVGLLAAGLLALGVARFDTPEPGSAPVQSQEPEVASGAHRPSSTQPMLDPWAPAQQRKGPATASERLAGSGASPSEGQDRLPTLAGASAIHPPEPPSPPLNGAVTTPSDSRASHSGLLAVLSAALPQAGAAVPIVGGDPNLSLSPQRSAAADAATPESGKANAAGGLQVEILSVPPGAEVSWKGTAGTIGRTPLILLLRPDDEGRALLFRKQGLAEERLVVRLNEFKTQPRLEVSLRPRKHAVGASSQAAATGAAPASSGGSSREDGDVKVQDRWDAL